LHIKSQNRQIPMLVGAAPKGQLLVINLNSGGFLSPPLRRGCRAESNKAALPQEFGATGEVKHLLQDMFDLLRLRAFALAQRARAAPFLR
jgi:hypothetical protein